MKNIFIYIVLFIICSCFFLAMNPTFFNPSSEKMIKKTSDITTTSITNTVTAVKNNPVVSSWPKIAYLGIISDKKSNQQLTLVQINGQRYSMKLGDTVSSVELTKAFRDSIEVKLGKEKKFFRK